MNAVQKFRSEQKKGGRFWGAKLQKPISSLEGEIKHFGKNNPYVGLEDNLQKSVATILDLDNRTKGMWTHVANEGQRHIKVGAKNKAKGLKKGVSDCLVFRKSGQHIGLAIELKVKSLKGNKGVVKPEQKEWLLKLQQEGWFTCVCWSTEAVQKVLNQYFST